MAARKSTKKKESSLKNVLTKGKAVWAIVIAVVAGIASLLGYLVSIKEEGGKIIESLSKPKSRIEIIIDNSEKMLEPFDGTLKRDVMINAVSESVPNLQSGEDTEIAIRIFGSNCPDEDTTIKILDFDRYTPNSVRDKLESIDAHGNPNLVKALTDALREDFKKGDENSIYVFTAGGEGCQQFFVGLEETYKQMKEKGIEPKFNFIGLELEDVNTLYGNIVDKVGGEILNTFTEQQLNDAIEYLRTDNIDTSKVSPAFKAALEHLEKNEFKLALQNFLSDSRRGNTKAMVWAGKLYYNPQTREIQDLAKAKHQFLMAAQQGDADGLYFLGAMLKNSDRDSTKTLWEEAIKKDQAEAQKQYDGLFGN